MTRPKYKMLMCDLQGHDCRHRWMFKRTYFGYCLQQNASWFFRFHPKTTSNTRFRWVEKFLFRHVYVFTHTLFILDLILNLWSFTFLWNASDSTFGWNGNVTGMSVFYTHYASKLVDMGEDLNSKLLGSAQTAAFMLLNSYTLQYNFFIDIFLKIKS